MRDPRRHAACAYLASVNATKDLCKTIYKDYETEPEEDHARVQDTRDIFNEMVAPTRRLAARDQVPSAKAPQ